MRRLALLLAAFAAAGCSHGVKHVGPGACAKARALATKHAANHALRGDVDGDGVSDSVALVRLRSGYARCGAVLVVRTRRGTLTRAFRTVPDPRVPILNGLASLAAGRGLQIVVTTWEGASTAFASVFAVQDHGITGLSTGTPDGTFPYEGSVTHFDAVDCVRGHPGLIVASGWFERGMSGTDFGFVRRFYRVGRARFEPVRRENGTSKSSIPPRQRLREFAEPQPFPSCMRVRAAS